MRLVSATEMTIIGVGKTLNRVTLGTANRTGVCLDIERNPIEQNEQGKPPREWIIAAGRSCITTTSESDRSRVVQASDDDPPF
jgi:hypothetical protein